MNTSELTIRQKKFCELYASSEEFFANGTQSYIKAFSSEKKPISYNSAKVNASKLLANVSVCKYINQLLDGQGLNQQFVNKQLVMLITQHVDLHLKLNAIREFNRLKIASRELSNTPTKKFVVGNNRPHPMIKPDN